MAFPSSTAQIRIGCLQHSIGSRPASLQGMLSRLAYSLTASSTDVPSSLFGATAACDSVRSIRRQNHASQPDVARNIRTSNGGRAFKRNSNKARAEFIANFMSPTWRSQVFRRKSRVLGDTGQHPGADFVAIVKCKDEVTPSLPRERAVRT